MNINTIIYIFVTLWGIISIRTLLFWLQQWQIREYRCDRLWDHLWRSKEGQRKIWNLWFFKGLLPRPKWSARMILITGFTIILALGVNIGLWALLYNKQIFDTCTFKPPLDMLGKIECILRGNPELNTLITLILTERLLWLCTALGVFAVKPFVNVQQRKLFQKAHHIITDSDKNIIRIGLSGSFGKSSTKEILVHLLKSQYGEENVLYNPANNNNEVAIAQLIVKNKKWLSSVCHPEQNEVKRNDAEGSFNKETNNRFLVIETGAYKRGEVALVCDIVQPHYGIITGLNTQHLSLFGSVANVKLAETELAHKSSKKVFYNAQSPLLKEAMDEQQFQNVENGLQKIDYSFAQNIQANIDTTSFTWDQQDCLLPWAGKFFVLNAMLALEVAKELGCHPEPLSGSLADLPSLKRALNVTTHPQGFTLLNDPYSANPDGVLAAIEHLSHFKGRKIFVGIPLIELGNKTVEEHTKIFEALKNANIEVYWLKSDHEKRGKSILGKNWKGSSLKHLKKTLSELKSRDALLLESRLPKGIL